MNFYFSNNLTNTSFNCMFGKMVNLARKTAIDDVYWNDQFNN